MTRALGRIPSRRDPRTLQLRRYVAPNVAHAAPPARDWTHSAAAPAWRVFANDRIGCCTVAAIGHALQAAAANTDRPAPAISDADVVGAYSAVTGYDPARPETDRGAQMLDVLRHLHATGLAGVRLGAYAAISPQSRAELEVAVNLTGFAYVGLDLPLAARDQTVWDVAPAGGYSEAYRPGSWGGHAAALLGYDRTHVTLVSWGAIKIATVEWLWSYCSEAWAVIDPLWLRGDGLTPSGVNAELLARDLAAIGAA